MGYLSLYRKQGDGITIYNEDTKECIYINVADCRDYSCKVCIKAPSNYIIKRNELMVQEFDFEMNNRKKDKRNKQ